MKVILPFKVCLLACSVLAGGAAFADPIFTTQSFGPVNSIEFSFMDYSSAPSTPESPDVLPPAELPPITDPQNIPPPVGDGPAGLPPTGQPGPSLPVGAPAAPDQEEPDPAAAVPEPATLALLGVGLIGIALRRRV